MKFSREKINIYKFLSVFVFKDRFLKFQDFSRKKNQIQAPIRTLVMLEKLIFLSILSLMAHFSFFVDLVFNAFAAERCVIFRKRSFTDGWMDGLKEIYKNAPITFANNAKSLYIHYSVVKWCRRPIAYDFVNF